MARQSSDHTIRGTIDNLCFYAMEGKFYVRKKSSLSGKRVKKDPAFANTMRYAGLLADASRIASTVYQQLLPEQKVKGFYRKLTGEAMQLLKAGESRDFVEQKLKFICLHNTVAQEGTEIICIIAVETFADALIRQIFATSLPECTGAVEDIFRFLAIRETPLPHNRIPRRCDIQRRYHSGGHKKERHRVF